MGQSNFLQALGWAVFNSLWQFAFLWVTYQAIIALFRIKKSSAKSSLATLFLFTGFAWFLYTAVSLMFFSNHPAAAPGLLSLDSNEALRTWLSASLPVASVLYLAMLIIPIVNLFRNYRYVQLIRNTGLHKASLEWRLFVRNVAERMNINKAVRVWVSDLVSSPVTVGYLKPVILLPMAAINQLTPVQMEAILLHELSHIRRFDYLINLITRIIQSVLYFNPFVRAFSTIIEREREKSCDELVLQFQYDAHGYAAALLTLEKAAAFRRRSLTVAASGARSSELLQRIEAILGISKQPAVSYHRLGAVLAGVLCIIALNAVIILSKPGHDGLVAKHLRPEPSTLFFSDMADRSDHIVGNALVEAKTATIINTVIPPAAIATPGPARLASEITEDVEAATDDFRFASFAPPELEGLNEEQEKQVKDAFEMSKSVLERVQWKQLEKSIADALTLSEKALVQSEYRKSLAQLDWDKIEKSLRGAYDNIDWKSVNATLESAMIDIKLDSIQQAYDIALSNLSELKVDMEVAKLEAIPDTDITAAVLDQKKAQLEKQAVKVSKIRNRKIVRL